LTQPKKLPNILGSPKWTPTTSWPQKLILILSQSRETRKKKKDEGEKDALFFSLAFIEPDGCCCWSKLQTSDLPNEHFNICDFASIYTSKR
jgi:hypothetical protein